MKCIIYIPLPTNKVVLYNYVHSIFVKWLLNFVCILFRVSCIPGQRILEDPLPYICVFGRTQSGILYGECKREFSDPLQFWWKVCYSERLIQNICFNQTTIYYTNYASNLGLKFLFRLMERACEASILTVFIPMCLSSSIKVAYRGGGSTPPPKFRRPTKIVPNSTWLWKLLKLLNLGRQHPKMFGKKAVKF